MSFILIYDIGKTNKKAFVFDQEYRIKWQKCTHFEETFDEDGDPCEDLQALERWVKDTYEEARSLYPLRALNFCTYGATLVFLDGNHKVLTPMYNYLKPFPQDLQERFYAQYGKEVAATTASPVLGSLNSGLLAYRIKYEKPKVFAYVRKILHLPNYMSFLFTQKACTDLTSVGCHTKLWDFKKGDYHAWVEEEGIRHLLPALHPAAEVKRGIDGIAVGIGLHDSSSALLPYLRTFEEPFVLISTGTWNITFNPFTTSVLTEEELENDCLCYLRIDQKPIKAARLLAGIFHDEEVDKISMVFGVSREEVLATNFDPNWEGEELDLGDFVIRNPIQGKGRNWLEFVDYREAYHQLISDLVALQVKSSRWVLEEVPRIFVDGGFGKNHLFMEMLRKALPDREVWTVEVPQASAIGAAMVIHEHWNEGGIPYKLITLTAG
jgi:L-fuculokinase